MADARESSHRSGIAIGFLAGLVVAGIPLVIFMLRPPPEIVVQVPAAPASRPDADAPVKAETQTWVRVRDLVTAPPKEGPRGTPAPKGEPAEERQGAAATSTPSEGDEAARQRKYRDQEQELGDTLKSKLKVRVTNADTGVPMPRVDMSIFIGTANGGGCSTGARTNPDGSAELQPLELLEWLYSPDRGSRRERFPFGSPEDPLVALVRIRVPGFEPFAAPATGELLDAKLEPLKAPRLFGTLHGRVLGPDGSGWSRPVVVSLQDPVHLDGEAAWVVPGHDGRFELSGIAAGTWGAKINEAWGPRARVEVPAGGATEVELRLNKEEAEEEREVLPESRRAVSVVVSGRDFPLGAAVLLQDEWGHPLRAAVAGGAASFPGVPLGPVHMTLRRPDGKDEVALADVREGTGVQEIAFPAAR